ncbi:MAG: hypothetical protein IPL61_20750 [Myxococcales bacterium]|nr:hypothetical protein [Myxococcales bacterium]
MIRAGVALVALSAACAATTPAAPAVAVRGRAAIDATALAERAASTTTTRVDLERAELGGAATADHAFGVATLEAVRSAAPSSAMGIDGDSLVIRIRHAAVGGRWRGPRALTVEGSLGVVPDAWIAIHDDDRPRALGRPLVEDAGLVLASDLALGARVALGDTLALAVQVGNGEGARDVERNRGKSTTVVVSARRQVAPLGELAVHGYGRDGSVGPGSARSHRLGGALAWHRPGGAAASVELVRAWGVDAQADATALALSAWLDVPLPARLGVAARGDRLIVDGPTTSLVTWRTTAAGWYRLAPGVRVELALELERADADAAPLPGAAGATDATRGLVRASGTFEVIP